MKPPSLVVVRGALERLDELAERPELKTPRARRRLLAALETKEDAENMTPPRPFKDADERKGKQTAIRITEADVERLDRLAQAMGERTGLDVVRSAAMRAAMLAGLDALEVEYGVTKAKRTKKAK